MRQENTQCHRLRTIFMLSTGRAGTGTFAHLFQQSGLVRAYHTPKPEMIEENFLVQQGMECSADVVGPKVESIKHLATMNICETDQQPPIYAETNAKTALFAEDLDKYFDAKFFWVIRDPYEYVNSGLNRKWYTGAGDFWDQTRERPIDGWPESWGYTEKIAWQWCCINSAIERQIPRLTGKVRVFHFSDLRDNPEAVLQLVHWLGLTDIHREHVDIVFNLNINSGTYSAPRDTETGDHVFGQKNVKRMPQLDIDRQLVRKVILQHWDSPHSRRYTENVPRQARPSGNAQAKQICEPTGYVEWIKMLKDCGGRFCRHEELTMPSEEFRVFLRHDIDEFNPTLMDKCRLLEQNHQVTSTWFFLPPGDKRYAGHSSKVAEYIRQLLSDGFEVGYHVNAWEVPGTYEIAKDVIVRLEENLEWFRKVCGAPIRIASAHGIPRHKDKVSNFSMFEPLLDRGVKLLDFCVIKGGAQGRRIPHFGYRSDNPLFPEGVRIIYTSDSGGPIRREWDDIRDIIEPATSFILNMHCANYDIDRRIGYRQPGRVSTGLVQSRNRRHIGDTDCTGNSS